MSGALKVELVESSPDLHLIISILGPALVLIGAIAAATIAAKTAGKRQERQLAHDRVVFYEQLAHDRRMRYEAHVKDVLDAAVETVSSTLDASAKFRKATLRLEAQRDVLGNLMRDPVDPARIEKEKVNIAEASAEFEEASAQLDAGLDDLLGDTARLRLRLGEHPIVDMHMQLHASWREMEESLLVARGQNRTAQQVEESTSIFESTGAAYASLMSECERWFIEQGEDAAEASLAPGSEF